MKKGFNILLILCAVLSVMSCSKYKTFTDMLNDQKKAISRLIDKEGIVVLNDYPKDGVFKENEYVKLKNGVYLNVIDSGNGDRAVFNETVMFCRFNAQFLVRSDTTWSDNISIGGTDPLEFKYGQYLSTPTINEYFLSQGLTTALDYVGDSASVKLIVPFNNIGSSYQSSYGYPLYYKKVKFVFKK